jgi:4,5-DOPA dioxygenase extradiol
MVIGSGGTVHNLRRIHWGQQEPEPWAVAFDDWLLEKSKAKDLDALFAYPQLAPNALFAIPRAEHFVPFLIAFGAGQLSEPIVHYRSYDYGTLSYLAVEF